MKNKINNQQGFTLIELMVVMTIIGLIASAIMISVHQARMAGEDVQRIANLRQLATALELYYDEKGEKYPATSGANRWSVMRDVLREFGYASNIPQGIEYEYWVSSDKQSYVLKARLDNPNNPALANDVDGSDVYGADCNGRNYCIVM